MDEGDNFQALFFIECDENLSDLQTRLDALLAGDRDAETVNAAFRAVHSVKGGAAAFGFMGLVGFAHDFETVMDGLRSGLLDLTPDACEVLLRAGDVMAGLVEATRAGEDGPAERVKHVTAQLAALLDPNVSEGATTPAAPPGEAPAEEAEPLSVVVRLAPRPDFLLAGFDPARIIRAARAYGLTAATAEGSVPPIEEYEPGDCPLAWRMAFELDRPVEALRAFLAPYSYGAEITLEGPAGTEAIEPDCGRVDPSGPLDLASEKRPAELPEPAPAEAGTPEARSVPAEAAVPKAEPVPHSTSVPEAKPIPDYAPAAPPAKPAAEPGSEKAGAAAARSLRVDLDRVDRLVNLVGEVLIAQAAVAQGIGENGQADFVRLKPLVESLSRQTRELQESVMAIRAQPVRTVFARLPRVVRDLCDALGKEARLVMHGEDVEVDTTVIEELTEPLVHMIRNAMDHGLESPAERTAAGKPRAGTLTLMAEQRGGRVRIVLSDDGRGINRDAVLAQARAKGLVPPDEALDTAAIEALIFHPGFSTAAEISAVSGRGVGMDVVRRKIQALSGRCVVSSVPGEGTSFTITLPLTLAVMDGMAIQVGEQHFILPLSNVVEAITIEPERVTQLPDRSRVIRIRDGYLPLYSLRSALALPEKPGRAGTALVVDTETSGHIVVLVDDLLGQKQVVLKSLEQNVGQIDGVGGATILGDGRVALVLDVPALLRLESLTAGHYERMH